MPPALGYRPAPRPALPRVDWRRAGRAMRVLIRDSSRTDAVFEIIESLSGRAGERMFQRFVARPEGVRLLWRRPDLLAALSDPALRDYPPGTLGRAYADFMAASAISADGLVEADEGRPDVVPIELDEDREWFFGRLRDMHDLWHVLTGYGSDEAGEVANLAFSYAQTRSPGVLVITLVGTFLGLPFGPGWPRYVFDAYLRGRRAADLTVVAYEDLLRTPLSEVRAMLAIEDPEAVHPDGVVVANRRDLAPMAARAA